MIADVDAIIVGSGPIGTAAARRMAEGGLQVLILEGGVAITDPPGSHLRNRPEIQSEPDAYFETVGRYVTAPPELPGAFDASLVGGQGILWTNNCPRAADFEWCDAMSPEEWDHWYSDAERMLEVVAEPTAASQTGKRVCQRLQEKLSAAGRSIRGLPFAGRELGEGKIHYLAPWDILAAASDDSQGRVTIWPATKVTRLLHEEGRIVGVQIQGADDERVTFDVPVVILAGGAIATPTLLHASGIQPPALGRGYSFHNLLFGQVVLEPDLCAETREVDIAPRNWIPPTPEAPWHVQVMRDTCPLPACENVDNPHRLLEFQAFVPVESRDENAIVFSDEGPMQICCELSELDRQRMHAMEADVRRLARLLGPWRKGCEPTWIPKGAHLMATCRVDSGSIPGVAERNGRVRGFENLYLGTIGLLPQPTAVNPTLTALALMLRSCDEILRTFAGPV